MCKKWIIKNSVTACVTRLPYFKVLHLPAFNFISLYSSYNYRTNICNYSLIACSLGYGPEIWDYLSAEYG